MNHPENNNSSSNQGTESGFKSFAPYSGAIQWAIRMLYCILGFTLSILLKTVLPEKINYLWWIVWIATVIFLIICIIMAVFYLIKAIIASVMRK